MKENLFSERLRSARREKGMTQQELADLSKLTRVSIVKYEQGESLPNVEILKTLSQALDVSADWLIGIKSA